jgi:hypothetical protein
VGVLASNEEEADAVARAKDGVAKARQRRVESALPPEDRPFQVNCRGVPVVGTDRVSDEVALIHKNFG